MKRTLALWMLANAAVFGQFAETPHPRLWFPSSAESTLRQKIAQDPLAAQLHEATLREADSILQKRTCRYEIPDGRRLLRESRLAIQQIMHCAWAWRMTGKPEYLQRAVAELEAACSMKDWNPSHFLDVAEMASAVAVGYDWLYGTNYHVLLLAACQSLKHPVNIPDLLEKSGNSMIHLDGPTQLPFNFADGHASPSVKSPAQSWIASQFQNAGQAKDTRDRLQLALDQKRTSPTAIRSHSPKTSSPSPCSASQTQVTGALRTSPPAENREPQRRLPRDCAERRTTKNRTSINVEIRP